MIVPNAVDERLPFGAPKFVLFSTLNASIRASMRGLVAAEPELLVQPEVELVERPARARRCAARCRTAAIESVGIIDVVGVEVVVDRPRSPA